MSSLQELSAKYNATVSQLESINKAFEALGVPYEGEGEGDSEIEIKIPAEYETKTLQDLSSEAKEWHRDITTITEVFDPERSESTIRTLATGSWQFYLASVPIVIFGVAKCLRGVNQILRELIDSKALLKQLVSSSAPTEIVTQYEDHLNSSVGTKLSKLASDLVDEYYKGTDAGRKSELKNALTQSLKRLSKKLSEGSKVSLRLTERKKPKVAEEGTPTAEELAAIDEATKFEAIRNETIAEIQQVQRLEHDPEIAKSLPSPEKE